MKTPTPQIISKVILITFIVSVGVYFFIKPLLNVINPFGGTRNSIEIANIRDSVAYHLMSWEIFGRIPQTNPENSNLRNSIASQIRGIRGFTRSDGFLGDGEDWYEFELSSDLAKELREGLNRSQVVMLSQGHPSLNIAPNWWPKEWPINTKIYNHSWGYLILPEKGTKAWFLYMRA